MAQRAAVRGVILDVDGTLVDSNDAHARAWASALVEDGFPQTRDLLLRMREAGLKLAGLAWTRRRP